MKKSINKKALAMLLSTALALSPCAGVYAQDLQGMDDPNEILDVQEMPEEQEIPEAKLGELQEELDSEVLNGEVAAPDSVSEGNVEVLEAPNPNEAEAAAAESAFDIQDGVLVKYTGSDREVVIPEGVTRIGASAFEYYSRLEKLVIPEGVVDIGESAFYGCSNLKSIEFPVSLESIGSSAFGFCSKLKEIVFPESVVSIGDWAFEYCNLEKVVIPKKVNYVGKGAFNRCRTIIVDLENPLYDSRDNCNAIIESGSNTLIQGGRGTVIPGSVTSIGSSAFADSTVENIKIPEGVVSIGESAFSNCYYLDNMEFPASLESIGDQAFQGCGRLKRVVIP